MKKPREIRRHKQALCSVFSLRLRKRTKFAFIRRDRCFLPVESYKLYPAERETNLQKEKKYSKRLILFFTSILFAQNVNKYKISIGVCIGII